MPAHSAPRLRPDCDPVATRLRPDCALLTRPNVQVTSWDFERVVPAHFDAPIAAGPKDLAAAFDFLATGTARALWAGGWDAAGWRSATQQRGAAIEVDNLDLLLLLKKY